MHPREDDEMAGINEWKRSSGSFYLAHGPGQDVACLDRHFGTFQMDHSDSGLWKRSLEVGWTMGCLWLVEYRETLHDAACQT